MQNQIFDSFLYESNLGKLTFDVIKSEFKNQDQVDMILRFMRMSFEAGQNYELIKKYRDKFKA